MRHRLEMSKSQMMVYQRGDDSGNDSGNEE